MEVTGTHVPDHGRMDDANGEQDMSVFEHAMRWGTWRSKLVWLLLLATTNATAQTTHLIRGLDFYYDPDTVVMLTGDSIHFQTQGIHDMVQTDSAAWAINQAISNGGFVTTIGADTTFVIDTAGTYYFVCSPHGFVGMKGVLLVDTTFSTGLRDRQPRPTVQAIPSPARDRVRISCGHPQAAWVELYGMHGELLREAEVLVQGEAELDVSAIASGHHVVLVLDRGRRPLASGPLMIMR